MPRRTPSTLTEALGLGEGADHFYERVRAQSGRELVFVARALLTTVDDLVHDLTPLLGLGIARIEEGRLFVDSPTEALVRVLEETAASAARAHRRLEEMSTVVPLLTGSMARLPEPDVAEVQPLDGETTRGGQPAELLHALIRGSRGDLRWLRPDRLSATREKAMLQVVSEAVAEGRRSLAIYPVRALTEARDLLAARAEAGEEIRVLPDIPTRLLIIGTTHAVLPEPLGFVDEPRSLVRQRGIVQATTLWYETMWDRALPVPDLQRDHRPDVRRLLLQQLAEGVPDEQIARRLGVSLRTVRRRVADLLTELDVGTRFQAGAEAARRGWL